MWKSYSVIEKNYKEKITPGGKNIEIKWECTKKVDEYSKFKITVEWGFFGINDIKAVKDGKEVKMQHGEIDIRVTVDLVLDYQDKWEESAFLTFLKSFYEKYLYVGTIGKLKGDLWDEGWKFFNEIKAFVELYTYEV